ncbi:late competence development ComFB family protein [Anaerovorax sp. IOR16]|uniref:late competence development ComFB family protein n=1 Tax=Anaerovorax sp. IOR16 TaxID=2773458 RepID=UPI0019D3177B|nr:late competence development ComFB family protein [Anaerovorax sp. IOR16]
MSKKSSKTSHVLNLLTNRIGTPEQEYVQEPIQSEADVQEQNSVHEQESLQTQPPVTPQEATQVQAPVSMQMQESAQVHQIDADEKIDSVQNEPLKIIDSYTTSEASTSYSLPSEDPLSDLIRQELEQHFETEILPFVPEDFSQKGNTLMSNFSEIENQSTLDHNTIDFFDTGEYVFVNIIEEFVKNECSSLMNKMEVCCCNKCKNDVIALALNHLPPKYVVTRKGYLLSKLLAYEKQYKADVLAAVTNACLQVKSMPHHSE